MGNFVDEIKRKFKRLILILSKTKICKLIKKKMIKAGIIKKRKNIEILLFVYRDLMFGKVLYVHPDLIENLNFRGEYEDSQDGIEYAIESSSFPAINYDTIYVWGEDVEENNRLMRYWYNSSEEALEHLEIYKQLIEAINKLSEEDFELWRK